MLNIEAAIRILTEATKQIEQGKAEADEYLEGQKVCYPSAHGTLSATTFNARVDIIHALRHLEIHIDY